MPPDPLSSIARYKTARLTTFGRKTGRAHTVPVWFVVDRDRVYLSTLRMKRDWPRNVAANGRVELEAGGRKVSGRAAHIDDRQLFEQVVELLRRKYWAAWVGSWLGFGPEGAFVVTFDS